MTTPLEPLPLADPETARGVLVEERPDTQVEDGDHERFAHYVKKDQIVESAVTGKPVIALCGKVWVPGRDPDKFPVCPDCRRIIEAMFPSGGDGS
ncbi:MAG: DUF3039 domain-containing protein [Frankiales bacterium]|nr:DUF3039 domain-containing protein [Frankiales bacterium]